MFTMNLTISKEFKKIPEKLLRYITKEVCYNENLKRMDHMCTAMLSGIKS